MTNCAFFVFLSTHCCRANFAFVGLLVFTFNIAAIKAPGQTKNREVKTTDSSKRTQPKSRRRTATFKGTFGRAMSLDEMIDTVARECGISRHLLASVVRQESGGHWNAVSPKGARGLGQLMPGTALRFGVRNVFNPLENLRGSARYIRWLLDYYNGDVRLTLAAYNAGEGAVDKYGRRIPPYRETVDYVAKIYPRFVMSATGKDLRSNEGSNQFPNRTGTNRERPILQEIKSGADIKGATAPPAKKSLQLWFPPARIAGLIN